MADGFDFVGAIAAPLPMAMAPALASLAATPPSGRDWVHEIKFDGYRMLGRVDHGGVALFTRQGNDWTARLGWLKEALGALPVQAAWLDGELVALDARGATDFQALQDALGQRVRRPAPSLAYFVFDLLYLDGRDLRGAGLVKRKALLARTLAGAPPVLAGTLRLSDHVVGKGPEFFTQAVRLGLEGIVSKQADAPYRPGRGWSWLKVKHSRRQEFVVVGFSDPKGARGFFGALLLATYERNQLVYRGRVGTGFGEATLRDLHRRLVDLRDLEPPFARAPDRADTRDVHWVKPVLVAEVSFTGITHDGLIRQAAFRSLREDKAASEVALETIPAAEQE